MNAPGFRRKLKDRQLTVGSIWAIGCDSRRRFMGNWPLSMATTAEVLHRYRTQSHIVPETRKLDQQSYIASSRKAPTGCPAQQQSNFQRPWLHLDCISSRAPSCSLRSRRLHRFFMSSLRSDSTTLTESLCCSRYPRQISALIACKKSPGLFWN